MKKISFLLFALVIGMAAFSQDFTFLKGKIAPGKIADKVTYEKFLSGDILVMDAKGNEYKFVSAAFSFKSSSGSLQTYNLTKPQFSSTEIGNIVSLSAKGTVYTFSNIVVKDKSGKQHTLTALSFELDVQRAGAGK